MIFGKKLEPKYKEFRGATVRFQYGFKNVLDESRHSLSMMRKGWHTVTVVEFGYRKKDRFIVRTVREIDINLDQAITIADAGPFYIEDEE